MVSSKIEDLHQKVSSDVWYMWILDKCDNTSDEIVKFATSTSSDAVKRYAVKLLISRKFEPSSVTKSILSTNDTTLIHSFLWLATVSLFKKYESSYAVEEIWPGYYCDESRKRYCIVFVYSIDFDRSPQTFWGIPIYYRNENAVSMEAREVMMYEQRLASTLKHIKDFHIADRVHDLFNCHSKLIMISCSRIKSSGYANKALKVILEPCVVLYCRIKGIIPVEEGCFPTIWNGYKVDVREAFCVFSADKRSLRMGDSIRAKTMESYGTIGGFVDLPLGGVGVITCAHVVCPASVLSNATTTDSDCIAHYTEDHCIEVTCPPQSKTLGTVEKVAFYVNNSNNISVDAALIKLKSRYPEDGRFREVTEEELSRIGYNCNFQPTFHTGEIAAVSSESCHYTLIKVGAVSGITKGLLQLSRAHAKITTKLVTKAHSSLSFTMNNQYEVQPVLDDSLDINAQHFATSGDSGSLVFMQMPDTSGLKCCGMVVATTSHGSCLMTPIENVLTDLGLSVQSLKRFHLPEESSPRPQDSNLSQTERILMSIKEKVDVIPSLKENVDAIPRLENNVEKINDELQDTKVRVGVIEKRVTGYHCNIL